MNDHNTFRISPTSRISTMLANRGMRSLLLMIAAAGAVNIRVDLFATGILATLKTGLGWLFAVSTAVSGYGIGAGARHRSIGRWIAYPVDADGTPTAPPMTGQLLMDDDR